MQHSACGGLSDAAFSPSGIVSGRWNTQTLSCESTATPPTCPVTHLFGNVCDQRGSGSKVGSCCLLCAESAMAIQPATPSATTAGLQNKTRPTLRTVRILNSAFCIRVARSYCSSLDIQFSTSVNGGGGPGVEVGRKNRNRSLVGLTSHACVVRTPPNRRLGALLWKLTPARTSTAITSAFSEM